MAGTYTPITKTLTKAIPSVTSDNIVNEWHVEVLYEYAGDETNNLPAWSVTYSETTNVFELNKVVNQFTKQDLIDMVPLVYEERIFHDHYESFVLNAKEPAETVTDFSLDQLS